jgi:hypothetical protein
VSFTGGVLHRVLTVKLRGRPTTCQRRGGPAISTGSRRAQPPTHHGPLQRLLEVRIQSKPTFAAAALPRVLIRQERSAAAWTGRSDSAECRPTPPGTPAESKGHEGCLRVDAKEQTKGDSESHNRREAEEPKHRGATAASIRSPGRWHRSQMRTSNDEVERPHAGASSATRAQDSEARSRRTCAA